MFKHTAIQARHYNPDGELIWGSFLDLPSGLVIPRGSRLEADAIAEQGWSSNSLADEGESDMLDVYFRNQTAPTNFYARLYNDTPVDTDTLATLTGEASGNGYGALTFARGTGDWGAPALDSGDHQITSGTKQFSASGGSWGPVTYAVLASAATGTAGLLINYAPLSQSRTLADGDSLDLTWAIKAA